MNTPSPKNRKHNKTVEDLISFIEKVSESFTNSVPFKTQYSQDSDEDHLTELLVWHCIEEDNENYAFIPQTKQKGKRKVDIGIGLRGGRGSYIFCIEAKFLPHSPFDYVTGEYAAIKRFKAMEHGINNSVDKIPLPQSGIIAYVKSGTFEKHLLKINREIQKVADKYSQKPDDFGQNWNLSEQLEKIYFKSIAKLLSKHPRKKASDVTLYHFWVHIPQILSTIKAHKNSQKKSE